MAKRFLIAILVLAGLAASVSAQSVGSSGVTLSGGNITGTVINEIVASFLAPIEADIVRAIVYAKGLMWVLLTLDLVFLGVNIALGRSDNLETIIMRLLTLGIIVFVVKNFALATAWPGGSYVITNADLQASNGLANAQAAQFHAPGGDPWNQGNLANLPRSESRAFDEYPGLAGRFLDMLVGISAHSAGLNSNLLANPGSVLVFAQDALVTPVVMEADKVRPRSFLQVMADGLNPTYAQSSSGQGPSALGLWIEAFIYQVVVVGIYIILTVNLCLAVIEFYLILLFAMILLPFISFEPLRFIGSHAFSAVIGQAVRTAIVVTIITLGVSVMWNVAQEVFANQIVVHANGTVTVTAGAGGMVQLADLMVLVAGSALLLYLALHGPNLAMSLLTGTPAFSAPHLFQNAYAGGRLASLPVAAASGVARFATGTWDAFRGRGGGGAPDAGPPSGPAGGGGPISPLPPIPAAGGSSKPEFAPPSVDSSALLVNAAVFAQGRSGDPEKITLPPGARTNLYLPNERARTINLGPLPWEKRS